MHWGATIVACTSSAAKGERLKALGADRVINTSEQDFIAATFERYGKPSRRGADVHKGIDVVVNYTGGDTWVKSMRCLKVGGRLLTCGATAGFDPLFGARPLKRAIQQQIENPLSKMILEGQFGPKDTVHIDFTDRGFAFNPEHALAA